MGFPIKMKYLNFDDLEILRLLAEILDAENLANGARYGVWVNKKVMRNYTQPIDRYRFFSPIRCS